MKGGCCLGRVRDEEAAAAAAQHSSTAQLGGNKFLLTDLEMSIISRSVLRAEGGSHGCLKVGGAASRGELTLLSRARSMGEKFPVPRSGSSSKAQRVPHGGSLGSAASTHV